MGCASIFGKYRRDLGDVPSAEPTVGGSWPEGGLLDEPYADSSPYQRLNQDGTPARPPIAQESMYYRESKPWVNADNMDINRRDRLRKAPSYADNPNLRPDIQRMYKKGDRATAADFIDESQNESSLWASNGQTNYYFTKNRIRSEGDIVKLLMEERMIADVGAELKRSLNEDEREIEIDELKKKRELEQEKANRKPAGTAAGTAAKKEEKSEEEEKEITFADVDLKDKIEIKPGEMMMAEILERYANGNYKIRGTKRVTYRGRSRTLNMIGIAKHLDISDEDSIASGKLYEYRLQMYQ